MKTNKILLLIFCVEIFFQTLYPLKAEINTKKIPNNTPIYNEETQVLTAPEVIIERTWSTVLRQSETNNPEAIQGVAFRLLSNGEIPETYDSGSVIYDKSTGDANIPIIKTGSLGSLSFELTGLVSGHLKQDDQDPNIFNLVSYEPHRSDIGFFTTEYSMPGTGDQITEAINNWSKLYACPLYLKDEAANLNKWCEAIDFKKFHPTLTYDENTTPRLVKLITHKGYLYVYYRYVFSQEGQSSEKSFLDKCEINTYPDLKCETLNSSIGSVHNDFNDFIIANDHLFIAVETSEAFKRGENKIWKCPLNVTNACNTIISEDKSDTNAITALAYGNDTLYYGRRDGSVFKCDVNNSCEVKNSFGDEIKKLQFVNNRVIAMVGTELWNTHSVQKDFATKIADIDDFKAMTSHNNQVYVTKLETDEYWNVEYYKATIKTCYDVPRPLDMCDWERNTITGSSSYVCKPDWPKLNRCEDLEAEGYEDNNKKPSFLRVYDLNGNEYKRYDYIKHDGKIKTGDFKKYHFTTNVYQINNQGGMTLVETDKDGVVEFVNGQMVRKSCHNRPDGKAFLLDNFKTNCYPSYIVEAIGNDKVYGNEREYLIDDYIPTYWSADQLPEFVNESPLPTATDISDLPLILISEPE